MIARHAGTQRLALLVALLGVGGGLALGCDGAAEEQGPVAEPRDAAAAEVERVVLIVLDTIRADRLSGYGYARRTTPAIDSLIEDSLVFERAYSHAPWTAPSIAALLTSRYPTELGIRGIRNTLGDDQVLLSELFQQAGWATGGVISHSFCSARWGFGQGFASFDESNVLGHDAVTSAAVTDRAIDFVDAHAEQPFFLFVHYFDPHYSYIDHADFDFGGSAEGYQGIVHSGMNRRMLKPLRGELGEDDLAELDRIYDSEVALTDHHVGRLLDHLRELGLYEGALIALTGDHGEEFFDHGDLFHTKTLYDELVRVPLVVRAPGVAPARRTEPVGLVDVFPTLAQAAGLEYAHEVRGQSALGSEPTPLERPVFFETSRQRKLRGIALGRHKLILDLENDSTQLFDVVADPAEARDLSASEPERRDDLLRRLREWMESNRAPRSGAPELELDDEERERLRALGYL